MSHPRARVVVVGGGIAGLACALGLARAGADVEVVERARELKEIGGALSLWPNAVAALDRLGVEDAVREVGWSEPTITIRASSGRDLVRLSEAQVRDRLGGDTLIVHRADLQGVLLRAARGIPIRLGWECVEIETAGTTVVVRSSGGEERRADAVLGCDGVRSLVGSRLAGTQPLRYCGVTTWRAVVDEAGLVDSAWLAVGQGKQFVASPLVGGRCYWSPMLTMPEGANARLADPLGYLERQFRGWPDPIATLIDRTEPSSVLRSDVYDRTPTRLADGRIAVAGDAAHPMTPALGQGACQALVDAAVLGSAWQHSEGPVAAFAAYQRARLRSARRVVADSRRMNRVFASRSRVVDALGQGISAGLPPRFQLSLSARHASRDAFCRALGVAEGQY